MLIKLILVLKQREIAKKLREMRKERWEKGKYERLREGVGGHPFLKAPTLI